ncbi:hypothetical protein NP233_g1037 [Leucocoprinus birnbaumii]|uniref:DUF6534 domain-containing protein n=1 Tax=Leucocoprinus birnbaumii TaxID=56174 RepID=A0AAD5W3L3_9AGAR|nr:hypothetical protein NP233_g1037 [Leucocoprinus birnbaumii]
MKRYECGDTHVVLPNLSMATLENEVPKSIAAVTGPVVRALLQIETIECNQKVAVHLLFLLDTVQTVFTMEDTFYWFGYHFGDTRRLYEFHFAAIDIPALDALIALLVQMVYCWRISALRGWKAIPLVTASICVLSGAVASLWAYGISDSKACSISARAIVFRLRALTDIIIAVSMTYINDSIGMSRSLGRKIVRLLTLILETNTITAVVAIETAVIFYVRSIAPPTTNIYEPGGYLLGKLYSNCFMILLNQRRSHRSTALPTTVESGIVPAFSVELTSLPTSSASRAQGSSTMCEHSNSAKLLAYRSGNIDNGTGSDRSLSEIEFAEPPTDLVGRMDNSSREEA